MAPSLPSPDPELPNLCNTMTGRVAESTSNGFGDDISPESRGNANSLESAISAIPTVGSMSTPLPSNATSTNLNLGRRSYSDIHSESITTTTLSSASRQRGLLRAKSGYPREMYLSQNTGIPPTPSKRHRLLSKLSLVFRESPATSTEVPPMPSMRLDGFKSSQNIQRIISPPTGFTKVRNREMEAAYMAAGFSLPGISGTKDSEQNEEMGEVYAAADVDLEAKYGKPPQMKPLSPSTPARFSNAPDKNLPKPTGGNLRANHPHPLRSNVVPSSRKSDDPGNSVGPTSPGHVMTHGTQNMEYSSRNYSSYMQRSEDNIQKDLEIATRPITDVKVSPAGLDIGEDKVAGIKLGGEKEVHDLGGRKSGSSSSQQGPAAQDARLGLVSAMRPMPRSTMHSPSHGFSETQRASGASKSTSWQSPAHSSNKPTSTGNSKSQGLGVFGRMFGTSEPSLDALNKLSKEAFADCNVSPNDPEAAAKMKVARKKLPPEAPNPASKDPRIPKKKRGGMDESPNMFGRVGSNFENLDLRRNDSQDLGLLRARRNEYPAARESRPSVGCQCHLSNSNIRPVASINEECHGVTAAENSQMMFRGLPIHSVNYSTPTSSSNEFDVVSPTGISTPETSHAQSNVRRPVGLTNATQWPTSQQPGSDYDRPFGDEGFTMTKAESNAIAQAKSQQSPKAVTHTKAYPPQRRLSSGLSRTSTARRPSGLHRTQSVRRSNFRPGHKRSTQKWGEAIPQSWGHMSEPRAERYVSLAPSPDDIQESWDNVAAGTVFTQSPSPDAYPADEWSDEEDPMDRLLATTVNDRQMANIAQPTMQSPAKANQPNFSPPTFQRSARYSGNANSPAVSRDNNSRLTTGRSGNFEQPRLTPGRFGNFEQPRFPTGRSDNVEQSTLPQDAFYATNAYSGYFSQRTPADYPSTTNNFQPMSSSMSMGTFEEGHTHDVYKKEAYASLARIESVKPQVDAKKKEKKKRGLLGIFGRK